MKTVWKIKLDNWGNQDHIYYVGVVPVARVCYNTLRSKAEAGTDYRYYINLPALTKTHESGTAATLEKAKDLVDIIVKSWFKGALHEQ